MRGGIRVGIVMLAAGVLASGCFGPFNLTRRLYRWNKQVQGKWEREFMFLEQWFGVRTSRRQA